MAIKSYNPTTPGRRQQTGADFSNLTRQRPEKKLTEPKPSTGGRNSKGFITSWWRGDGHKRRYRVIDFKRDKRGIPATVQEIEYDPNRTARIALLAYADGEKRYILAPVGLAVGQKIEAGEKADIVVGNALPLGAIPLGTMVHNIELKLGAGGKIVRSAGAAAQIMGREGGYVQLRLPSSEVRKIDARCYATVGQVGNLEHENLSIGKAGRSRWLGRKPHNRGVVMNPVDHPMGGGEGKTSGGRQPVSPWGWKTKGRKTRNNKRTDRMIVRHRK